MTTTPEPPEINLGGFTSLKNAHKEMAPKVGYHGFRDRVLRQGMSVLEAGTAPKSNRGRPRKVL